MKAIHTILFLVVLCGTLTALADDIAVRLDVGTAKDRVTFTVVVENNTDKQIDLRPIILAETNIASSVSWHVNGKSAEFFPKRSFLMYPPFDIKTLPPHSTNAVVRVEDNELVFVTKTDKPHSNTARAALPSSGEYTVSMTTEGYWGGHKPQSASVTVKIEKESPTKPCT
jgi:hypothetical protein